MAKLGPWLRAVSVKLGSVMWIWLVKSVIIGWLFRGGCRSAGLEWSVKTAGCDH